MLGTLIPEVKKLISETKIAEIKTLQEGGNLSTHTSGGRHQSTDAEFLVCKPQLESLVNWLFSDFLNRQLPYSIREIFSGAYKNLKVFKPFHSVVKTKVNQQFVKNLLYFTQDEKQMMQQIVERLKSQHQVLLLGEPATGKSMMAFEIAGQLQGYQVYYWSLARSDKGLWEDIESLLYRKVLFIIDDCHLDVDTATWLGSKFHDLSNVSAALLFVSRNISKDLQRSSQLDWFNLFDELQEVTFRTESRDLQVKVKGIIETYQAYYEQSGSGQYVVGDEAVVFANIRNSLVVLYYYLELWKERSILSEINEQQVLGKVYEKYFRHLEKKSQVDVLLQYACLYMFEVEFESLPDVEEDTKFLAKQGIILEVREYVYSFYHSDFADLLLRAYAAYGGDRFKRKNKKFENFLFKQIKRYLLSFNQDDDCPDNVHAILSNISGSNNEEIKKVVLLEKLLADKELKELIIEFYSTEANDRILKQFVSILSKNTPAVFNKYFQSLVNESEYFEKIFFYSKNSFGIYIRMLMNLRKNDTVYNVFLCNWEKQELSLIEHAGIQFIGLGLCTLIDNNCQDKARQLYNSFDNEFFILKIQEANLAHIGSFLIWLSKVNPSKTAKIFAQVDNELFIPKIQEANLQSIGHALIGLNQVNKSKTAEIFAQVENEDFITKIQEANLQNIGHSLIELNQINKSRTAEIFAQIDNEFFILKIQEANLDSIGNTLNCLNQVNPSKTAEIFEQVANEFFIPKIQEANLASIGEHLNCLNIVNRGKTAEIFAQIDNEFFIPKIQEANLANIGRVLNELNKVNPSKTANLFAQIDNEFFIPKIQEANLASIGEHLNCLNIVNPSKTAKIFTQVDNESFIPKIQEASLAHIGKALNELNQVNPSKTAEIFAQVDNEDFILKIQEANLASIGHALIGLNQVNPSKTAKIFAQVDNEFFIPKIQEANLASIGHALIGLNKVNPSKTGDVFENVDNNLLIEKATYLNFATLAQILINFNKIDSNKTQNLFKILQSIFTVKKLTKEIQTVKYEVFISYFSIFPSLDTNFGKLLLQNLEESYLFQWGKLKHIVRFNQLLNIFRLAEMSKEDTQQLISFALKNDDSFLRCKKVSDIGSFLQLLANYIDIQPIIEQNVSGFVEKIRYKQDQTKIPKLIGIIHANAPDSAFYLFEQFKKYYPNAQETIGFTHYYIGKNYHEQSQPEEATYYLEKAETIFTNINHEIGLELVQTELEQIES